MKRTALILLLMLLFELAISGPMRLANCQEPSKIAITNISVVDVVRGGIQDGMTILVEDAKIVGVGRADSAEVPGDALIIDGTNKFAIPGLWDMHIHWYQQDSMSLFPINGVTGVRIMWGNYRHHQWRKDFDEGTKLGPRMSIASAIVDGPDPIWPGSIVASNAEEGRQAVLQAPTNMRISSKSIRCCPGKPISQLRKRQENRTYHSPDTCRGWYPPKRHQTPVNFRWNTSTN